MQFNIVITIQMIKTQLEIILPHGKKNKTHVGTIQLQGKMTKQHIGTL